jgi:hypothetical protein
MKIHSTFLYIGLSVASAQPVLCHAQSSLPAWLQPSWLKAKFTDFPVKNTDRYEVTQANVVTNNGSTNLQTNQQTYPPLNPQINPQMQQPQLKQSARLAPVETAEPKLNEKYLTAEELKELRRQLRQQR